MYVSSQPPVGGEDCAGGRHLALDESQRPRGSVVGQKALAAAEDERDDHQPEAVHETVLDERLRQPAATDDMEFAASLRLQRSNASATPPWSTRAFSQPSGSESVVVATYFGNSFNGRASDCCSSRGFGQ